MIITNHDYHHELLQVQGFLESYHNEELENLRDEFIAMHALEGFNIGALEDTVEETGEKKRNAVTAYIEKVITFVQEIFKKWMNKFNIIFKDNMGWLKDKSDKLKSASYDGIKVTVSPLWKGADKQSGNLNRIKSITSKFSDNKENLEAGQVAETALKDFMPKEGTLVDGLKNTLRFGSPDFEKEVELKDSNLRSMIGSKIIPIVEKYNSDANEIKNLQSNAVNRAKEIQREIKKEKSAMESFDNIMQSVISETGVLQMLHIVQEATGDDKDTNKVDRSPEVVNEKDAKNANDTAEGKTQTKSGLQLERETLKVQKNLLTVAMTVFEERFVTFMNLLRNLWRQIGGKEKKE